MSCSSETITSETSMTKCLSENKDNASDCKESKVRGEAVAAKEGELKGFLEKLKDILREFQNQCQRDKELLQVLEDQEGISGDIAFVEHKAAVILQGARGSKDQILRQGLELLGAGEWQKYFEENKLGSAQSYGCEELKSLETVTELDDELSALITSHLPLWESDVSFLPCTFSKMLLLFRKKRKLFERRIVICISIIRRLCKHSQRNNQAKLDELKIKLKQLELDWNRHEKNEMETIKQQREKKIKQKEKEEQRMAKEWEKREKNVEGKKQKMKRCYCKQQRDDEKRTIMEQRERRKMETDAEQQAIHRQAAVLENFMKTVPKLPPWQGINRRHISISDELQRIIRENSKQQDENIMQDLIFSIKRTRKHFWKELGIKQVSFGQCQGSRVKLLQFEESCRPPFYGVVQKPSEFPNGRRPYIRLPWLDYNYDSEMEWVESEPGESISESASEDDDSIMDTDTNSSSDNDSFFIDDEHISQNLNEGGFEECFSVQEEELVGIISCHDSNKAQRVTLSKFPRRQILNVKITNNIGTLSETSDDLLNDSENSLDDRQGLDLEMKENLKPLEEFWQIRENREENSSKKHCLSTGM
ncbi:uncharacterized protein Gasu_12570 [Galdieria sulphuraria]|uniref:Chromatin assembly factor 1 subunit A dimerization domain-containing protein n=1 Tax=Galdieria sulphuraria TaxID=130081 RepID=M2W6Z7_GALSU|nr:uncharacterized protein Gasu_12570 [Galdieria sulphuraria]EME31586.1 hypothetical protein Gasu_12570 [Galdieria sulphuraria]|eukprot:XP_005708106.1 hypothetical protein Gasu_12570 [Galdieria sulphuraria]